MNHGGKAHFLIDTLNRALLMPDGDKSSIDRHQRSHAYFKSLLIAAAEACPAHSKQLLGILQFLESREELERAQQILIEAGAAGTDNISFAVDSVILVEAPQIRAFWRARRESMRANRKRPRRMCLATGRIDETVETTEKIRGVPGTLPVGGNLISCDKPSFCSYGLEQAQNSPISFTSEAKIRAALNHLIARGTRIGRLIYIHWPRRPESPDPVNQLMSAPKGDVTKLLRAPILGVETELEDLDSYYVLALGGNGGRIVIHDWITSTLPAAAANIRRWFDDTAIISPDGENLAEPVRLKELWNALSRDKFDHLSDSLFAAMSRSAISGSPLPRKALALAVARQRLQFQLCPIRAGFIRACLLRSPGRMNSNAQDLSPGLNANSSDAGYVCGRLFAALDRLQYIAMGRLNAPITERFYASASATPALVMGRLVRNAQYYLGKTKPSIALSLGKDLEGILSMLGDRFPTFLDLEQQGRFALGFYHQKAEYRRRREKRRQSENEEKLDTSE